MSDTTPEARAERIRRLQERRAMAASPPADRPAARKWARRRHGLKTRVAVSALSLASFASLAGGMVVGNAGTSATVSATRSATTNDTASSTTSSGASSTASPSNTTSPSKASTTHPVTSTRGS